MVQDELAIDALEGFFGVIETKFVPDLFEISRDCRRGIIRKKDADGNSRAVDDFDGRSETIFSGHSILH